VLINLNNSELENIYYQSGSRYYENNLKFLIEDVLHDLYSDKWPLLYYVRLNHIDRAVSKYIEVSKTRKIYHTKNYFSACIKSAVVELGIDEVLFENDND
jgi:hypothetical protein